MLLVAGCGSQPLAPKAASAGYVPWLPLPKTGIFPAAPSPTPGPPIPIPDGTPACQAKQLDGAYLGRSGAAGNTDTPVALRNNAATACWLEGYPDISILDSANHVLATATGTANRGTYFGETGPDVQLMMLPGTTPFPANAAPGLQMERGEAYVNIQWYDCKAPQAARLSLVLPGSGGTVIIAFPVAGPYSAACDAGTMPASGLQRDVFLPGGIEWPPSPDFLTINFAISMPASVRHGSTLIYFVTLTNTSATDYVLDPCPDYGEFLGGKEPFATYRLNCAPAGHIGPGLSVKFEMHLDIPSDLAAGTNQLTWALYDGRLATPAAQAAIDIA
jgi:Protein of unknown function (DUF4232)